MHRLVRRDVNVLEISTMLPNQIPSDESKLESSHPWHKKNHERIQLLKSGEIHKVRSQSRNTRNPKSAGVKNVKQLEIVHSRELVRGHP